MVGRPWATQHQAVETIMILETVQHAEAQPLLIEAQQGIEIVARSGDAQDRHHGQRYRRALRFGK